MVWVKFESVYTETDRYGNTRSWENRVEAMGSNTEVSQLLSDLSGMYLLPGVTSLRLPKSSKNYLLEDEDWGE